MTQTLFIGLDGASFQILDVMTRGRQGVAIMPTLKSIMESGYQAPLRSTPNPLTPPAWTSMLTGKNPGRHGIFDFMRSKDIGSDMFFTLNDFRDIQTETIWSLLSRQGRTLAALNFPLTAPPPEINGSLIPGFTSWKHLRRNTFPAGLFDRLARLTAFDPKTMAWDFQRENEIGLEMSPAHLAPWIEHHILREAEWINVAQTLLATDRPDCMAVMFDGMDKIQHQAWPYILPELMPHRANDEATRIQDLCREYFTRLDEGIDRLIREAGPETNVLIASDHGFCTTSFVLRINKYLEQLGYLQWHAEDGSERARRRAEAPFAHLDWNRTLAYCPTPSSNGIHIRMASEPGESGIRQEDYPSFRERLIRELYDLRDGAGNQAIKEVLLREEAFPGECSSQAPDLTLVLQDHGFVSVKNLEPVFIQRTVPAGTHHPLGVFIAFGPDFTDKREDTPFRIEDMAALLLHSQGLPVPLDFDGRVPEPCLRAKSLQLRPVQTGPPTLEVHNGCLASPTLNREEDSALLDQLRLLGYLE